MYLQKTSVCNGYENCPDGSDELCDDPCAPEGFAGKYIMKVFVFYVNDFFPEVGEKSICLHRDLNGHL